MKMNEWIWLDMDGTIADLYGVEGWLDDLIAFRTRPYEQAKDLYNTLDLLEVLLELKAKGYKIGIISWLSKESTCEYDEAVRAAKKRWLAQHLPSIVWDEIHLVKYGAPKHFACKDNSGILFDDNEHIRKLWEKYGIAYDVDNIIEILKSFLE